MISLSFWIPLMKMMNKAVKMLLEVGLWKDKTKMYMERRKKKQSTTIWTKNQKMKNKRFLNFRNETKV